MIMNLIILDKRPTPKFYHIIISGDIPFFTFNQLVPNNLILSYFSFSPQRQESKNREQAPLEYALTALSAPSIDLNITKAQMTCYLFDLSYFLSFLMVLS